MGNCLRRQLAASWANDDEGWESVDGDHRQHHGGVVAFGEEGRQLLEGEGVAAKQGKQVRIRISQSKLDELLQKVDERGLPLHRVLRHLVSTADSAGSYFDRSRHWQPA